MNCSISNRHATTQYQCRCVEVGGERPQTSFMMSGTRGPGGWAFRSFAALVVAVLLTSVPASAQRERKRRPKHPPTPSTRRLPAPGWEGFAEHVYVSAAEAAQRDAMGRLARRIESLQMGHGVHVETFIRSNPNIEAAMWDRLGGVAVSKPRYTINRICTVRVKVSIKDVIAGLKQLNVRYGDGRFGGHDFNRIAALNDIDSVVVIGQGLPMLRDVPQPDRRRFVGRPEWASQVYRVTGHGRPPSSRRGSVAGKLIASNRARLDARQRLAVYVRSLPLDSFGRLTVGHRIDDRPDLAVLFSNWLGNVHTVRTTWGHDDQAVVVIEADFASLWEWIALPQPYPDPHETRRTPVTRPREHKTSRSPRRRR